jgi:hypothetical protein
MPPTEDRSGALGEIAWDVLRRLIRDRLGRKAGGHLIEGSLDRVVLRLPLALRGEGAGPETFSRELIDEIDLTLEDAIQHAAAFRPGHAPCRKCDVVPCDHSAAPSHRHVFVGYTPTGVPRWEDFAQHCLDLHHPDVDRLYEDPPAFVTLSRSAEELASPLLEAIRGDLRYELCGQVAAGFFPVPKRQGEGRGILAVTFQVGVSRASRGGARYGLNVLGCTPQGQPLDLLWERQDLIPWLGAVRWAQAALGTLDRSRRSERGTIDRRVRGIVTGLARRLEHERRSAGRRTRHAEERHRDGERPTRSAVFDARAVAPSEVMVDERNGTLVVPGARGRMHFYTPGGRLVSSVRYSRDAIEKKRKTGLWRPSRPEESEPLLVKMKA